MKFLVLMLLLAVLLSGCVSPHHVADISNKREEVEVLREEMGQAIRNLDRLQRDLAARGIYSTEEQERDVDHFISVVRQARDRVAAEDRRLHQKYKVAYGPY